MTDEQLQRTLGQDLVCALHKLEAAVARFNADDAVAVWIDDANGVRLTWWKTDDGWLLGNVGNNWRLDRIRDVYGAVHPLFEREA